MSQSSNKYGFVLNKTSRRISFVNKSSFVLEARRGLRGRKRNVIGNMVGLSGSVQALKTYRDTLQQSSIREGERAHKLTVLYSANITQLMCSPFAKKY